ncbi:RluA family pseudouridine synthase [Parvibaculum sp.]|uniref:RluA family pseudouridine synthase n=1 Tax=Parvibaculum sp. TaxID=2024848 RepID=UPI001D44E83F|nr:RluA family pseudouridine synthase [Parvibaculum sp.]MBX3488848.1 RluA family pseudouridine synthase [Parvibaculum sp.]MCW5727269.1 RluA family pseudouridine synthase [Parvibaculum sp.]
MQPAPYAYAPPMEPLTILHRDDDILVLSKPAGLLTVPGKPLEHGDCLERRAQAADPAALLVHRLDRDTSGVVLMARNRPAQRHLGLQFERRMTRKTYVARVWGNVMGESGRVDAPIACDWPNRPKQMIDTENGRPAQTEWQVMAHETMATRMMLRPLTGRSHQLRVHMAHLGHPVLGDNFYAHEEALRAAGRLQLHALELTILHPADGRFCTFRDACPF